MQSPADALLVVDGDVRDVDGGSVGSKDGIRALGVCADAAALHINLCARARGIDRRVGTVETGVVARVTTAVVARLRDGAVRQQECSLRHLNHVVVGGLRSERLTALRHCRAVREHVSSPCGSL